MSGVILSTIVVAAVGWTLTFGGPYHNYKMMMGVWMADSDRRRLQVDPMVPLLSIHSDAGVGQIVSRLPFVVLASTRQSVMTLLLPLGSPKVPEVLLELRIPQQHLLLRNRSESVKREQQMNPKHHSDRAVLTR